MAAPAILRLGIPGLAVTTALAFAALFVIAGGLLIAPLVWLMGAAALAVLMRSGAFPPRPTLWSMLVGVFVVWAAVSYFWSPLPDGRNAAKFLLGVPLYAALALGAAGLSERKRRAAIATLGFLGLAAGAGLALEMASHGALTAAQRPADVPLDLLWRNLGHGASSYVVLLPPVVVALWCGGRWARAAACVCVAVAACASIVFGISANAFGLIAAVAAGALAFVRPRHAIRAIGIVSALLVGLAPLVGVVAHLTPDVVRDAIPLSWEMRLEIWRYAAAMVFEAPLFGHGFDASRAIYDTLTVRGNSFPAIPLHPHNNGLHVWLETGVVGAALMSAAIATGAWRVANAPNLQRPQAVAIAGVGGALMAVGFVSYGLWQEWWLATAFLAAAACLALGPAPIAKRT